MNHGFSPTRIGSDLDRARKLVLRHGRHATAYQIINPGISLWFSRIGDAVGGFVDHGRFRVVAASPVCDDSLVEDRSREFEQWARAAGKSVCYFGVEPWFASVRGRQPGSATVLLGAQPAWPPGAWPDMLRRHASLRAQLNRALNKGARVDEWPAARAAHHPALLACLEDWLGNRGLPPMHFLVEPETLSDLNDRRVFVAQRGPDILGFLVASPVPARRGWLIEQIIRGRAAVNGTSELLVGAAMSAMAHEGYDYATLGLAALSRRAGLDAGLNPLWLRWVFRWVRAHGCRFYNFEGLDAFKAKFRPESWEPVYAVTNEPRFTPRALLAIAGAFSESAPMTMVARALGRAVRTEWRWLWNSMTTKLGGNSSAS